MLLDRQSTVNVVMNNKLVKDTPDARGWFVCVHCNAWTKIIRMETTLPGFGTVWFYNRCIVNIISILQQKISTTSCMVAQRETKSSWLWRTTRSCSMRYQTGSSIMIWKTVIWYLSTQWKKTEKGSPTEICLGPGKPGGHWKCLYICHRKPLIIWYVP